MFFFRMLAWWQVRITIFNVDPSTPPKQFGHLENHEGFSQNEGFDSGFLQGSFGPSNHHWLEIPRHLDIFRADAFFLVSVRHILPQLCAAFDHVSNENSPSCLKHI